MDHSIIREVMDKLDHLKQEFQREISAPPSDKGLLDQLGHIHGTDKASGGHNYLHFYDRFLHVLRDQPITLLEIGVGGGPSLRMWQDYFPLGKIVGMDIHEQCRESQQGRISIEIGDQGNNGDLDRVRQMHGPFDVIVDDAGHDPNCQMSCYKYMFPYLKPGGFYILEDVGDRNVSTLFGKIAVDLVHGEDSTGLSNMAEFIATYRETSVTRRKTSQ